MAETVAIALLVAVGLGVGLAESRLDTVHAERLVIVTAGTAALGLAASGGVLVPLGVVLLFQLSALGYGLALRACLGLRGGASPWLELPAAMVLGWALLVVVGLAAGTLGLLFAPFVAVVGLTGIALAVGSWGGVTMRSSPTPTPSGGDSVGAARTRPVVWWWLAAIGLVIYVAAIAPEARHDALAAHLPIAVEFAARRAIVEIPHNAASYFQLSADLLYAMAMTVVTGEAGPKLLHLTAGIVAVALVFRVGARLWDSLAGVIAAAILAGTPLVWWVAGTAYTDLWVLLFAVGALDALLSYQERPGTPRALGVSLLAGASLGVKMPAAVIVVPVVVVLLVWIVRSEKGRRRWLSLAATAAGLVLTGAYWYVRNYLLLGNPFHPLFGEMFGRPPLAAPLTPWTFGMGQRPVDLLLLPWRVTVLPHRFVEEGAIGFHYLLFSPLALVAVARGCAPRWLAATLLTAGAVWVAGAQYLRFALPILVPAALLTARGVALATPRARRLAYAVLVVAVSAEAIAWTTLKGPYFPVGVVTGTMSREAYLTEHVPGYRVAAYARRHLPASARLLSIGEDFVYFYERAVFRVSWYGRHQRPSLRRQVLVARSGPEVATLLVESGLTHVVVVPNTPLIPKAHSSVPWVAREALWEEEGLRLLVSDGNRYLFAVGGAPRVADRGARIDTGEFGARAVLPVAAGTLYGLEAEVQGEAANSQAVLSLHWLDREGRAVAGRVRREVPARAGWRRVAIAVTAPDEATTVELRVEPVVPGRAQVRAARFYELR